MTVWAIADLHLSFGVPNKSMDVFGEKWVQHPEKIKSNWLRLIQDDDLVLLPGDISWGMHTEEAVDDLKWIDALPGTKVMLRGNHDFWWNSISKVEKILPPSINIIQNTIFKWNGIVIGGARLWDTKEFSFSPYIDYVDNPRASKLTAVDHAPDAEKIFERELSRLELSLKQFPKDATVRIAMTHYPPIGAEFDATRASAILEKYQVSQCVFGHLHNVKHNALPYGTKNGVKYTLVSADYVDFCPVKIL